MFGPVKTALGGFLGAFYTAVTPTTTQLKEFKSRGLQHAVVRAPGRLVDAAEDMLLQWSRHDTGSATAPIKLPLIIFALAKDYMPAGSDFARQIGDPIPFTFPFDSQHRCFGVRTVIAEMRAQIVFFSHDEPSARSLGGQFSAFLNAAPNRRFDARYDFAGQTSYWKVTIEDPLVPAMPIPVEAKNLTILAVDLTLKANVPLFDAPTFDQPNDGKGDPEIGDPPGYPVVTGINASSIEAYAAQIRDYDIA